MSGQPSPFNYQVQVLECERCGAPVTAPRSGGQVTCEQCGAGLAVTLRPERIVPRRTTDEASPERLAWLRQELADEARPNRFDTAGNWLPELVHLRALKVRGYADYARLVLPELRKHWQKARARLPDAFDDADAQYRVFWLAMRLSQGYALLSADPQTPDPPAAWQLRRRAVLETAHTMLGATRYAQVLRCELARAAARAGEVDAARTWLEQCDPEPAEAPLDTEYRLAKASVLAAEGDAEGVLRVLGRDLDTVVLAGVGARVLGALLRVHALELQGEARGAAALLHEASRRHGPRRVLATLAVSGLAPGVYARQRRAGARVRLGCLIFALALLGVGIWQLSTCGWIR